MVTKTSGEKATHRFRGSRRKIDCRGVWQNAERACSPGLREHRDTSLRPAPTPPAWPIEPRLRLGPQDIAEQRRYVRRLIGGTEFDGRRQSQKLPAKVLGPQIL